MFGDTKQQLGAVRREVGRRRHEDTDVRVVRATQTYDADIEDVWDACTSPDRIPRWFLPVSGDLRVGGRYQLEGNAGGEILACEPPSRLRLTWEYGESMSWVDLRLSRESAGRTTLDLEHLVRPDAHWEQFGPGAVGIGWDMILFGLASHLPTGAAIDPQQAMTWQVSDEAREFMARCSDEWRAADIAGGEDEAVATAAAARTLAAYTDAPPSE